MTLAGLARFRLAPRRPGIFHLFALPSDRLAIAQLRSVENAVLHPARCARLAARGPQARALFAIVDAPTNASPGTASLAPKVTEMVALCVTFGTLAARGATSHLRRLPLQARASGTSETHAGGCFGIRLDR